MISIRWNDNKWYGGYNLHYPEKEGKLISSISMAGDAAGHRPKAAMPRVPDSNKRKAESVHGSNKRVLRTTSLADIAEDSLCECLKYLKQDDVARWKQTSVFYSANKGNMTWLKVRLQAYVAKSKHGAMMREYTEAQLSHLFKKLTRWLRHSSVAPLPSEFPRAELDEDTLHKHAGLAAVKECGNALEWASDGMKDDKDVVLAAVQEWTPALEWASDRLKNDTDVVLVAVKSVGYALEWASDRLKNDKDIVLAAVKTGTALEWASDRMKDDKDIVLAAVKRRGGAVFALECASDRLKNDTDVVLAAVKRHGWALRYASPLLQDDTDVVLAAVKTHGFALRHASDRMKDDKELVLAAVKQNGWALRYASPLLQDDKDVVLAAVKIHGYGPPAFGGPRHLQWASDRLKSDTDVLVAANPLGGESCTSANEECTRVSL